MTSSPILHRQKPALSQSHLFLPTSSNNTTAAGIGLDGIAPAVVSGLGCANPNGKKQVWDFREKEARDYFVKNVIAPWANVDAVDGVFVDEGDAVQCRWQQFPALTTLEEVYGISYRPHPILPCFSATFTDTVIR